MAKNSEKNLKKNLRSICFPCAFSFITQCTMCDFHDFGLTFFCFCTFENVEKCVLGGCTITSKAKINVFWNFFFTPLAPFGLLHSKKFPKTLILAFEANSALSRENETKIVKITHSAALQSSKNILPPWEIRIIPCCIFFNFFAIGQGKVVAEFLVLT